MITTTNPVRTAILATYLEISTKPQDYVRLARLRPLVQVNQQDVPREVVDAELLDLIRTGLVHLVPQSDRKALTADDHAAAIKVGNQVMNLLAVENGFWQD